MEFLEFRTLSPGEVIAKNATKLEASEFKATETQAKP